MNTMQKGLLVALVSLAAAGPAWAEGTDIIRKDAMMPVADTMMKDDAMMQDKGAMSGMMDKDQKGEGMKKMPAKMMNKTGMMTKESMPKATDAMAMDK